MSGTAVLEHPGLGRIRGVVALDGVHQYRGLPYAQIPARWEHSVLLSKLPQPASPGSGGDGDGDEAAFDATAWGPMAPQPADSIKIDFGLIQKEMPVSAEQLTMDEFGCLNLVVTKPSTTIEKKLPVLFVIHGGAFFLGASSFPQYDTSRLVQWSAKIGKPLITVSINYRLGHLGFLASQELGPTDAPGNFGLFDQENALRWVQATIAGFGGDPDNVTCFGESAGGISTHLHLLKGERLFARAACLSGDVTVRPMQSLEKQEERYKALLSRLGIADEPSAEARVAKLRETPAEQLCQDPANFRPFPTNSGGFVDVASGPEALREQAAKHFAWCKETLLSECTQDVKVVFRQGSLYMAALVKQPWEAGLDAALKRYMTADEARLVYETWQIGKRPSGQNPLDLGLVQFITDVRFYWPVARTLDAASADAKLHVYHFNQPNPFDGPAKGLASHELDLALLLLNYSSEVDATTRKTSELLATHIVEFTYGLLSEGRSSAVVFDAGTRRIVEHEAYDEAERGRALAVLRQIGPAKCFHALELFQFGEVN
ncbi:hypothetical protein KEM52_006068 [Ascosphaera acerosa]|nr:hypothetical protein KEM52_006068 [Ascosphaera acerosa]